MGRRSRASFSNSLVEDEIGVLLLLAGGRAGRRLERAARAAAREQQTGSQHKQDRAHEDASLPSRDGISPSTAPGRACPSASRFLPAELGKPAFGGFPDIFRRRAAKA